MRNEIREAGGGGGYSPRVPGDVDEADGGGYAPRVSGDVDEADGGGYAPVQAPRQAPLEYGSDAGVTPMGQQGKGVGPGVRDRARAQQSLSQIQQAVSRFENFGNATQGGYTRNQSSGADKVQHYINDEYNRAGNNDNFVNPATLMYDMSQKPTRLVGVMLTADANRPLPDFGAGAWHRHPGDDKVHMHVWFDRGLDQDAFENNTGYI